VFDTSIISRIADLGHEIGYHYEDFYTQQFDRRQALNAFKTNLSRMREISPVHSISMHGSPLSKYSNLELWNDREFETQGVKDCTLSYDWRDYAYFTDTGRTFGPTDANLRDRIVAQVFAGVRTTDELRGFIASKAIPKIFLNIHPERWTASKTDWMMQYMRDSLFNGAKRSLHLLRRVPI